jgi:aldose sugar dehydrogenase
MITRSMPVLTAMTAALTALLVPAGATASPSVSNHTIDSEIASESGPLRLTRVVSGLEHPWAVAWLPDGRMLVTERPGRLLLVDDDSVTALSGLPKIDSDEDQLTAPEGGNQGGLLDVVVHPDYASNGWIYFTYSSPGDDDSVIGDDERGTGTALARADSTRTALR